MNRFRQTLSLAALVTAAMSLAPAIAAAQGQSESHRPVISLPVAHDASIPLRDIKPIPPRMGRFEKPLRLPNIHHVNGTDTAVQTATGPQVAATAGVGMEGVGLGNGYAVNAAPPDTNGSVGDTQYVQWVNEGFAVFNKSTGAQVYPATGAAAGNTLFAGFGGACESNNDGDPIVLWDKAAHRWIMTQFSVSTTPYLQCIAVSQTADATGAWNRYSYSFGTGFNDYPKFGVWPDAYYATYNIFNNGSTFAGAKACAYDRTSMMAGAAAPTQVCFSTSTSYGGLLPSDLDGATAPAAGSPNYVMNFGSNSLNLWKFHVDWSNTANSTFTGPTNIPVASFTTAGSVPQAGTSQKLDSLSDRLMYRLAYRNIGGHDTLLVNHSVAVASTARGKKTSSAAVRWYELRGTGGTFSVYQQGTFAPDTTSRWMGSIAMDKVGNIAVGYSKSSSTMNPAIFFTGRAPTDALGTMQAEAQLKQGTGSQLANLSRWGDYSSLSLDSDDCTMWYTTEYIAANGTFNWHTSINSIKFPTCN
jgi:hypothetical protein